MATIAIMTSADDVGIDMSAGLREAIVAHGHRGIVMSIVKSSRFSPLPHLAIHGMRPQAIADICRTHGVDLIVPVVEAMSELAADVSAILGLKSPTRQAVATLGDKFEFLSLAGRLGVSGSRAAIVTDADGFDDAVPGPIFVKPTRTSGSHASGPYDYGLFASCDAFRRHLIDSGQLEQFLSDNRTGGAFGRHMICEYIDVPETYNVAILTAGGRSTPFLNMALRYMEGDRSGSAVRRRVTAPIGRQIRDELVQVIDGIAAAVGLEYALWGLEFAIDRCGRLRLIEAHTRLPQSHGFVSDQVFADFWPTMVAALTGQPYTLECRAAHAIRETVILPPGVIRRIEWPVRSGLRLVLAQKLKPGFRVPEVPRRPAYEPAVCAVGDDLDELERRIAEYIDAIRVDYETAQAGVI